MQSKPNFAPPQITANLFMYKNLTHIQPETGPAKQTQFQATSDVSATLPLEPDPFADYLVAMYGARDGAAATTKQPYTLDREVHNMTEVRPHRILVSETLPGPQVLSGAILRFRGPLTIGHARSWERVVRCVDNG